MVLHLWPQWGYGHRFQIILKLEYGSLRVQKDDADLVWTPSLWQTVGSFKWVKWLSNLFLPCLFFNIPTCRFLSPVTPHSWNGLKDHCWFFFFFFYLLRLHYRCMPKLPCSQFTLHFLHCLPSWKTCIQRSLELLTGESSLEDSVLSPGKLEIPLDQPVFKDNSCGSLRPLSSPQSLPRSPPRKPGNSLWYFVVCK